MTIKYGFICLPLLALLCSCGEPRRYGDVDGIPVTVSATVERAFFKHMENRQGRPSAGIGFGASSSGHTSSGVGVGLSFSTTQVYLVGGDAVGQSNIFSKEVRWGTNSFTVPLTPGRTLHLTAIVEGGRRGWEAIGTVTVPTSAPTITISLTVDGVSIQLNHSQPLPSSQALSSPGS
jgi:hypothetical protein